MTRCRGFPQLCALSLVAAGPRNPARQPVPGRRAMTAAIVTIVPSRSSSVCCGSLCHYRNRALHSLFSRVVPRRLPPHPLVPRCFAFLAPSPFILPVRTLGHSYVSGFPWGQEDRLSCLCPPRRATAERVEGPLDTFVSVTQGSLHSFTQVISLQQGRGRDTEIARFPHSRPSRPMEAGHLAFSSKKTRGFSSVAGKRDRGAFDDGVFDMNQLTSREIPLGSGTVEVLVFHRQPPDPEPLFRQ